jgi:hypothetical protein
MNFAVGPEKQFMLTQVHDSAAELLFALSLDNKADARPIMDVLGKDEAGAMAAGEDFAIGDMVNTQGFCMIGRSNRV